MNKWWAGCTVAVCVLAALFIMQLNHDAVMSTLRVGQGEFAIRVARTDEERERGLSGTTKLPADRALLFVFPSNDTWGIWMKDMNYPIDIVWLDENKTVIFIKQHASPSSYPGEIFKPSKRAKYVVEFAAGATSDARITIGSQAVFDSTKGTFE